jgi:hypothetical protein
MDTPPQLIMSLPQQTVAGFAALLQHGILLTVDRPVALLPFLLSLPGFDAAYIENTVQTIFINGVAVDSLDRSLPPGATLALSAAMPGLAGAIFRRQGLHGSLRSQPAEKVASLQSNSGFVTLKLFNSIATDRVCDLLAQGINLSGRVFHDFAAKRAYLFQPPAVFVFAGQSMEYVDLLHVVITCDVLQVKAKPACP